MWVVQALLATPPELESSYLYRMLLLMLLVRLMVQSLRGQVQLVLLLWRLLPLPSVTMMEITHHHLARELVIWPPVRMMEVMHHQLVIELVTQSHHLLVHALLLSLLCPLHEL